jgi:hypothetical protein
MNSAFTGKYKSWAELFLAFRIGELSKTDWTVRIDNDHATLHYIGPIKDVTDEQTRYEEGRRLFYYDKPVDVVELLDAFAIPAMSA